MRKLLLNLALIAVFLGSYISVHHNAYATVTTATNIITYVGDNSTTVFSFPNLFFDEDHLVVKVDQVTKTITTDYTVIGEGVQAGGTVTFLVAPALDTAIVIERVVPFTQLTDFSNFDGNPADVTEKQFDLNVMMSSQIGESSDRNITVPVGTTLTSNDISGTIDTTTRVLTITTAGPATALVGSLDDNLTVTLSGQATGDILVADDATTWSNQTQASLGLLTDVVSDTSPQLGGALDTNSFAVNESEGAAVASATTTDIFGGDDGNTLHITGTTTIVDFTDASSVGQWRKIIFDGILTFTHGSGITLPGSANITTAAGDYAFVYADTVSAFTALYFRADGTSIVGGSGAWTKLATATASNSATIDFTSSIDSTYEQYVLVGIDIIPATDNTDFYMRTTTDGGSTFDSSAGNYDHHTDQLQAGTAAYQGFTSASDTKIIVAKQFGSTAGESANFTMYLYNPAGTNNTILSWCYAEVSRLAATERGCGAGARLSAADVDGIRYLMSSGNITSGEFKLYGIEK